MQNKKQIHFGSLQSKNRVKLFDLLKQRNIRVAKAYEGGLRGLDQKHSEKFVQSASSLREVVYLLTRLDELEEYNKVITMGRERKTSRKHDFMSNNDPINQMPKDANVLYDQLRDHIEWFSNVIHHRSYPNKSTFIKKLCKFELILLQTLESHFDVIYKIDKILEINHPEKNFRQLQILLSRNTSTYSYFFNNASAKWVTLLKNNSYFDEFIHHEDNSTIVWSPIVYLWKISKDKPKIVSDIILDLNMPKNVDYYWRMFQYCIDIAVQIPPKLSKKIVKKICMKNLLRANPVQLQFNIIELMKKMLNAGFQQETLDLMCVLLDVKSVEEESFFPTSSANTKVTTVAKSIIDNHVYIELLSNVILEIFEKFPKPTIERLVDILTKIINLECVEKNRMSCEDPSTMWRPAIENSSQNFTNDFKSHLLGKLADLLIIFGKSHKSDLDVILHEFDGKKDLVFKRLILYIYMNYPKRYIKEIECVILKYFDKQNFHHEYFHLLQKTFSMVSVKTKNAYLDLVQHGPSEEYLNFRIRNTNNQNVNRQNIICRWKYKKILPILNHCSTKNKKIFVDILKTNTIYPHPDFLSYHTSVRQYKSPSELKDNLTPKKVIKFMRKYKNEHRFDFDSGTLRKLEDYVKTDPYKYSKLSSSFIYMHIDIIERFFRGLNGNQTKKLKSIEWESVLSLCKSVINGLSAKNTINKEPHVLVSMLHLFNDNIKSSIIPFFYRNVIWELLSILLHIQNENELNEIDLSDNKRAFTLTLNTLTGMTFNVMISYNLWCIKNTTQIDMLVPEVKLILMQYSNSLLEETVSRQAVLGYNLLSLYSWDKEWVQNNLDKLFCHENEHLKKSAWDAYLCGTEKILYSILFQDLQKYYREHTSKLESFIGVDEQLNQHDKELIEHDKRLIEHIVLAYLFNAKNSKNIFYTLINISNDQVLKFCAHFIGVILKQIKEENSDLIDIQIFKTLWEKNSLKNFSLDMWVRFTPFDKSQTLKLLYNSLQTSYCPAHISILIDELKNFINIDPTIIFKCLKLLIHNNITLPKSHFKNNTLKILFDSLLKNEKTISQTKTLINFMGEYGYNNFKP